MFVRFLAPARRLPNFRGKVKALQAVWRSLGAADRRVIVETRLTRPISYAMRLDLGCAHERMAFFMSGYEPQLARWLARRLPERGVFLDVGANIGLISIPAAVLARRKGGRVFALEPIKSNFQSLVSNVDRNALAGIIHPLNVAAAEKARTVEIQVEGNLGEGEGTGTANILAAGSDYSCRRLTIQTETIDALVERKVLPNSIDIIKLDTDGYDLFALQGARHTLECSRPLIFGEFMDHCLRWHGQSIQDVFVFAEQIGYVVMSPKLERIEVAEATAVGQDLVLVAEESVRGLVEEVRPALSRE